MGDAARRNHSHRNDARGSVDDAPRNLTTTLDWHEALRPYTKESFAAAVESCDHIAVVGCYPEIEADDDVSRFAGALDDMLPSAGRAIVALTRSRMALASTFTMFRCILFLSSDERLPAFLWGKTPDSKRISLR